MTRQVNLHARLASEHKRSGRRWGCSIAVLALCVILACDGYFVYHINAVVRNSYAVWWVANMVMDYMDANDGAWPKGWDDLREPYEAATKRSGQPWTFEELRERVIVDWTVDPQALANTSLEESAPSFRVIWLSDGSDSHWERHEPNRMIFDG